MFKRSFCLLVAMFGAMELTGCASIVDGTTQSVSIKTTPVEGARCTLTNNKGKWFVDSTPGSVTVHRSYEPLYVICQKIDYSKGKLDYNSKTKPMVFGNILFGGIIGAAIDIGDGAAYRYPQIITVPLEPKK